MVSVVSGKVMTEQIDNYPGFEDGIDGFSLAEKMQKQAEPLLRSTISVPDAPDRMRTSPGARSSALCPTAPTA